MKNKLITEIEQKMLKQLDNAQLEALHEVPRADGRRSRVLPEVRGARAGRGEERKRCGLHGGLRRGVNGFCFSKKMKKNC